LAERQAAQVVSDLDNRLEAYRATLNVLAVSPKVLEGDMEAVRSQLELTKIPADIWFTVRDRNGQQLLKSCREESRFQPSRAAATPSSSTRGHPIRRI
jgi:hypothetical protein